MTAYLPSVSTGEPVIITHYPVLAMVEIKITPTTVSASFQPQLVTAEGVVVSTGPTESVSKAIDNIKNQAVLDSIAILANKLKVAYDNRTP